MYRCGTVARERVIIISFAKLSIIENGYAVLFCTTQRNDSTVPYELHGRFRAVFLSFENG